jgi:hypothetical protein
MNLLPVAHGYPSGEVTKLLLTRDSVAELTRRFRVEPAYLVELQQLVSVNPSPIYVHPPAASVWAEAGTIEGIYNARSVRRITVVQPPSAVPPRPATPLQSPHAHP